MGPGAIPDVCQLHGVAVSSRRTAENLRRCKLERTRTSGTRPYVLRGRMGCGFCGRRMHGAVIRKTAVYYRCLARTLAPDSPVLADHPRTVNLRELDVLDSLNKWIGQLFAPENVDRTVKALVGSQTDSSRPKNSREGAKQRLADAQTQVRRLQEAIKAGADPAALVEAINEAQATRAAAQAELDNSPDPAVIGEAEVYAMVDSLGDVGSELKVAKPESLGRLYDNLNIDLKYEPHAGTVEATIAPRVVSKRVRGASCTLTTRLWLPMPE